MDLADLLRVNTTLRKCDLTYNELVVLAFIALNPGSCPGTIGRGTLLEAAAVSRTLNSLEDQAMLVREVDGSDKRSFNMSLSVVGRRVYGELQEMLAGVWK